MEFQNNQIIKCVRWIYDIVFNYLAVIFIKLSNVLFGTYLLSKVQYQVAKVPERIICENAFIKHVIHKIPKILIKWKK